MCLRKSTPQSQRNKLIDGIDNIFSAVVIIGILVGCFIILLSKGISIYNSLNEPTTEKFDISKYVTSVNWTVEQMENDKEFLEEMKLIEMRKNLTVLDKAREILKIYPVFDKQTDYGVNIEKSLNVSLGRGGCSPNKKSSSLFHEIGKMKEGSVGVRFWMAYAPCENKQVDVMVTTMQQVDINRRLIETYWDYMEYCTTLKCIVDSSFHKINGEGKIASLMGAEIGPIMQQNLGALRYLYHMGVRYVTLTQFCVTFPKEDPLMRTKHILQLSENGDFARWKLNLIHELNRIGFIIELNHVTDATLSFALKLSRSPIILSNFGEYIACRKERYLDDYLLNLVKKNGGLILINFNCNHVECSDMPRRENLNDIIRHIDYIRKVIGINHMAVGDINDGVLTPPDGLEDSSKYPQLFVALMEWNGWKLKDVRKIAYLNMLRVMEQVERVKIELQ